MILARTLSAAPTTDGQHIDLKFREEQDIIHTDAYGQNPLPFQRVSSLGNPWRRPYPWQPGALNWPANDALFAPPNNHSFAYTINPANSPPTLDVYGVLPVNSQSQGTPPVVPLQATTANTGGSIPPGTYLIAIGTALHDNGPVSKFITAVVPVGTSTNTITVAGVAYSSAVTPQVFLGATSLSVSKLASASWSGSAPDGFGNDTSFTITSLNNFGFGLPDPNAGSLLVKVKTIRHGGVWGDTIGTVAGGTALTFGVPGAGWTSNQWAGYTLSLYFRPGVNFQPGLNVQVTSSTAFTLLMAHSGFLAGDVVVLRAKSGSITTNTIGDANFVNAYGTSGLTPGAEVGNLIRIIAGTGAGQPPMAIASNTSTVLAIVGTWYIQPDSSSIFIVETPAWLLSQTAAINNDGSGGIGVFGQAPIVSIPLPNLTNYSLLIEGVIVDAAGNWSVERYAPIREAWVTQTFTSLKSLAIAAPLTTSGGTLGVLTDVTSGILINGSGQISVKNGSGIAFDGSGNLTVNAGVGLTISGGFLVPSLGAGLSTSGGQIVVPGGAITNSMLDAIGIAAASALAQSTNSVSTQFAMISVGVTTNALIGNAVIGTANIQNLAVTSAVIANGAVGTLQCGALDAVVIATGTLTVGLAHAIGGSGVTVNASLGIQVHSVFGSITNTMTSVGISVTGAAHNWSLAEVGGGSPGALLTLDSVTLLGNGLNLSCNAQVSLTNSGANALQVIGTATFGAAIFGSIPRFNVTGTGTTIPALSGCPSGSPGTPLWYEVNINGTLAWASAWV